MSATIVQGAFTACLPPVDAFQEHRKLGCDHDCARGGQAGLRRLPMIV